MHSRPLTVLLLTLFLLPAPAGYCQDTKENADFKLAINLFNDGLFDLAGEQLRQFINAYPTTPQGIEARFYLGLTQLKLKKYDDARLTFQTFALTYQDNPRAPEAWWNVGEAYAAMKNYKEAALAFERVKVFHPKHKSAPDALLRASRFFALAGEKDNARRVLKVILQEYPTSGPVLQARTDLARMYFEEGNLEQAQSELKRVIDGDPSPEAKAQALLILGNIDQTTGKIDDAEASFKEILTKYKSSGAVQGARVSLGKLYAGTGKYIEAIDNFKSASAGKTAADSLLLKDALTGSGDAYAALKDYPNAVASYEKFLTAFPSDERVPALLWKIADAASRGKNYRRSNEAAGQILKGPAPEPLRKRALIRLALNAEEQNSPAQAAQQLNAFIDQYPDDPSTPDVTYRLASLTENQLHDPRKAATLYEMLTVRSPQSPLVDDALLGAGRCYEQLKEYDRALATYAELARKYPASEHRQTADRRAWRITTFEAKDKDAGLEQLALLLGDVMVEKDRAALADRLGTIYYKDLKNYAAAAAQFTNALAAGLQEPEAANALYRRMRSFAYLAEDSGAVKQKLTDDCLLFIRTYPSDRRAIEAASLLFNARATSPSAARAAYAESMTLVPALGSNPEHLRLLLKVGELLDNSDSTAAALAIYTQIGAEHPSPDIAEEAAFRRLDGFRKIGLADSALTEAESYVAAFPSGQHAPEALAAAAELSLARGNAAHAAELYQQLAAEFWYTKTAQNARRNLADAHKTAGNYDAAIGIYKALVAEQTENPLSLGEADPSLLLALGETYHLTHNIAEAKSTLFTLLAHEHTGHVAGQAYLTLGLISHDEGALDNAADYFRQAEAAAPGAGATRDIADLLFDRGDYADAVKQYTQLSRTTNNEADRRYYDARIIVARLRENGPASVEHDVSAFAQTYRDADEDLATFQLEKGTFYFNQEKYAEAQKAFEGVTGKYDETAAAPVARYWIAKTFEATDKPQEAVTQLNRLIKDHPQADVIPRALLTLGNIAYAGERWDEAIKDFKQALEDPRTDATLRPMATSNLIETYDAAGAYDAALSLTRKYLEQYPNSDDALDKKIKIGILYDRLGYYDQAVLQLQSLLDEAGSDLEGEIRYYIAEANYNKGDFQQAILDFLKVPYLVTKKGKIDWTANSLYMAGQSYEKMGRYDQALTMYQQIVDRAGIDPTYKAAARKEIDRVRLVVKKKPE